LVTSTCESPIPFLSTSRPYFTIFELTSFAVSGYLNTSPRDMTDQALLRIAHDLVFPIIKRWTKEI
jgi:hypothetical protein